MRLVCAALFLLVLPRLGWALDVRFEPVAENVYAYIGDTGGRTVENQALNTNIGLVVTPAGAVLIDSGATFRSAQFIDDAVRKLSAQPVRWVINTGGQDHRWLGNGYFQARGAELIAHVTAVADMRSRSGDQIAALNTLLGEESTGTVPALPTRALEGQQTRLELGGVSFEFRHRGGGHTPGDMLVWLPRLQVLFAGDIVYVDRMLAVLPISSTRAWLDSFAQVEALGPQHIVPGHGRVADVAAARARARDVLQALRKHATRALEQGADLSNVVKSFNAQPFSHLLNAGELLPANLSRTYLEVERE